jgi:chromosome segregation ATPase
VLADKVGVNEERSELLEKRYEALSDMAYQLTENLQQERDRSELKIAKLESLVENLIKQNQEQQQQINRLKENHQREIAELKEQIRLMGVEKSSDKEKIVKLESQVKQLQEQVKELQERENKLVAENEQLIQANYELKDGMRRRSTDKLSALSADAEERLNYLEQMKAKAEVKGENE